MSAPKPIRGCGSSKCPKCGETSPCVDHNEVDIGIGFQTFDHEYWCPTHGGFAFVDAPGVFANFGPGHQKVVFRDDEESSPSSSHAQTNEATETKEGK